MSVLVNGDLPLYDLSLSKFESSPEKTESLAKAGFYESEGHENLKGRGVLILMRF